MLKELKCRDLGFDCEGVIKAATEKEVLKQAAEHARTVHDIQELTDDIIAKVRSAIRNV
jgi:predicted small metal-binding protein